MCKLKNKLYLTLLNNVSKALYGVLLFANTACGTTQPALTETQKLALDHMSYSEHITGKSPLEGNEA